MPRSVDTVLTINPDGTISADFTGHISALGIDLLAALTATPPNDRRIAWHDTILTGTVRAVLSGQASGAGDAGFFLTAISDTAKDSAVFIQSLVQAGAHGASLSLSQTNGGGSTNDTLTVQFYNPVPPLFNPPNLAIFRGDGSSDLARKKQFVLATAALIGVSTANLGVAAAMTGGPSIVIQKTADYFIAAGGDIRQNALVNGECRVFFFLNGVLSGFTTLGICANPSNATPGAAAAATYTEDPLPRHLNAGDVLSLAFATSGVGATYNFSQVIGWYITLEKLS